MSRYGSMDINIIYIEVNKKETTKNMKKLPLVIGTTCGERYDPQFVITKAF